MSDSDDNQTRGEASEGRKNSMSSDDGRVREDFSRNDDHDRDLRDDAPRNDNGYVGEHNDQNNDASDNANDRNGDYESKKEERPVEGRHVFISGLKFSYKDEDLRSLIDEFGPTERCNVVCDPHTGECRGFGFVTMENAEDARNMCEKLHDTELNGRRLTVELAKSTKPRSPTPGQYRGNKRRGGRFEHRRGGRFEGRDRDYRGGGKYGDRRDYHRRDDRGYGGYGGDRGGYDRGYDDRRYGGPGDQGGYNDGGYAPRGGDRYNDRGGYYDNRGGYRGDDRRFERRDRDMDDRREQRFDRYNEGRRD
eukprot:Nk52_evm57s1737 gene=Nk52_evmTU57s1737